MRTAGLILAAALFAAGCARHPPPPAGRVLRLSQLNEPEDLDPAAGLLVDNFFVIRALSEGLVAHSAGSFVPAAAERWEESSDGLTWTFHLNRGERWSNGEPVTARDFVKSYRRLLTPATAAPKADLFFVVKNARAFASGRLADFAEVGFESPDDRTLVVRLEHPVPEFLAYAASDPWIPVNPRVVARLGRAWTRPGNFVGNGPFVLAEWRPNQRIVVRKNPLYRAADEVRLDEIQFVRFDSLDAEERAYRAGMVDVTMTVPYTKLDRYAKERPGELHHALLAETRCLSFNVRRAPLDDLRVRQAISLAIDRTKLVEAVLRGGQVPAGRILPPGLRLSGDSAENLTADKVAFDAGKARSLLAAAGFPEGRGFPRLELSGWSVTPALDAIQEMLRANLGITVDLLVRDARSHQAALRSGRYDIAFIPLIPDVADPLAMLERFKSGAPGNYPHWAEPSYDELIESAGAQSDPTRRADAMREAEVLLLDEAPVAPLYYNAKNWLMRPAVRGWKEDAMWTRDYVGVYLAQ